jgi:hypothetical protein
VEAHCAICDEFWSVSLKERAALGAAAIAAGGSLTATPESRSYICLTASYGSTAAGFIRVITTGQTPAPLIDASGARQVAPAFSLLLLETCFAEHTCVNDRV